MSSKAEGTKLGAPLGWGPGPRAWGGAWGYFSSPEVASIWWPRCRSAASPDLLSPDSLTLLASFALASRQRRLLKSGWTLPGEARAAKAGMGVGVGGLWAGKLGSEPLPGAWSTTGFLNCGTISILGQTILFCEGLSCAC